MKKSNTNDKDFGYFKKSVKGKDSYFYSKYKNLRSNEICSGLYFCLVIVLIIM